MIVAGPILQGSLPFQLPPMVRTVGDARGATTAVDELRQKGVDFVKVGDTLERDAYVAIAAESRRLHIPFVGHLPVSIGAAEASRLGQQSIEHFGSARFHGVLIACSSQERSLSDYAREALETAKAGGAAPDTKVFRADFLTHLVSSYDERKAAALFSVFQKNGTWQVPTFVALRSVWDNQRSRMSADDIAAGERVWQKDMEMLVSMSRAGVKILAGTDLPITDGTPHLDDELVWLVKAGLTPMQALQAATRNSAEFLGRLPEQGTVTKGKVADLVILNASPLDDIANLRRVAGVVLRGQLRQNALAR
jgi:imidazolonepropionase-like amidohydrolase